MIIPTISNLTISEKYQAKNESAQIIPEQRSNTQLDTSDDSSSAIGYKLYSPLTLLSLLFIRQ